MLSNVLKSMRGGREYRFGRHGTFWHRFSVSSWKWGVSLCKFSDDGDGGYFALSLFCFWVTLWRSKTEPKGDMLDKWGVELYGRSIYLCWGHRSKFIYLPWMYDHCRTEVMLNDGRFVSWEQFPRRKKGEPFATVPEPTDRYRENFSYRYLLRSGQLQERTATVTVERRSWCWRGWPFRCLRWPSTASTTIDVQFDDEVGEGTGSWKGGTVGCGYELRQREAPGQCLRRMELERKFER